MTIKDLILEYNVEVNDGCPFYVFKNGEYKGKGTYNGIYIVTDETSSIFCTNIEIIKYDYMPHGIGSIHGCFTIYI